MTACLQVWAAEQPEEMFLLLQKQAAAEASAQVPPPAQPQQASAAHILGSGSAPSGAEQTRQPERALIMEL